MATRPVSLDVVVRHFGELDDPRSTVDLQHPLPGVIVLAVLSVLAGANGPMASTDWAAFKEEFLVAITTAGSWPARGALAWATSDACATVGISSTGCPSPSQPPWTSVPKPPRLRPRAFSAWPPEPSHFFQPRRRRGGRG